MAKEKFKRVKNLDGVKLVYKWGVGTWLTLLFGLLAIAVPVLGALLFTYYNTTGSFPSAFMGAGTGYDLLMTSFGTFTTGSYLENPDILGTAFGTLWFLLSYAFNKGDIMSSDPFFINNGKFFVFAAVCFLAVAAIFALVLFIMWFIMLVSGRLKHYKGPFTMAIWIFVFNFLYYVLAIVLMIGLSINHGGEVIPFSDGFELTVAPMELIKFFLWPLVMTGASLVLLIALGIIYKNCFFDHKFIKNAQELEDYKKRMANRKIAKGNVDSIGGQQNPVNVVINIHGFNAEATKNDKGEIEVTPVEKKKEVKPVEEAPKEEVKKEEKPVEKKPEAKPTPVAASTKKEEKKEEKEELINPANQLPGNLKFIGGHAFAQNVDLQVADIPEGIPSLGLGAFANCVNLKVVSIPTSVKEISANCFFNCKRLKRIEYSGSKKEFKNIKRGSNWLNHSGTTIIHCKDGPLAVNPLL